MSRIIKQNIANSITAGGLQTEDFGGWICMELKI